MNKAALMLVALGLMAGCGAPSGGEAPATPSTETTAPQAAAPASEIKMTDLPPLTLGVYTVQPMFEEKLEDGHFNIRITGGDVAAVREWVGPEDASGVVVVKTEIENDYYHGHVEMPSPIPADARLWIEIETPAGERLKGSTPLQ